jgi:hypothetical protein
MGARNRVGMGLSYRPARLHSLGGIGSLKSILGLLKSLKIRAYSLTADIVYLKENIVEETHAFLVSSYLPLAPYPAQLRKQATKNEERLSDKDGQHMSSTNNSHKTPAKKQMFPLRILRCSYSKREIKELNFERITRQKA